MSSTTWNTTIAIKNDNEAVQRMRAVLRRNLAAVPYRNGDVVAKYLRHIIDSSNTLGGIQAQVTTLRPDPAYPPRSKGLEQELRSLLAEPSPRLLLHLKQLACCAFGALMLLALVVTFAG